MACAPALRSAAGDALDRGLDRRADRHDCARDLRTFRREPGRRRLRRHLGGRGSADTEHRRLAQALVEALRRISPPVIRWPGGCFADSYDWRDGIGPRDKRPKRTNFWAGARSGPRARNRSGPQSYDPNQFGTVEFARFCKATGAQPYFAANMRGSSAQEFDRWVEYCNSPAGATTLADQRAADGEREPLNMRYWGVGNEAWGCGGIVHARRLRHGVSALHLLGSGLRRAIVVRRLRARMGTISTGRSDSSRRSRQKGELGRVWGWSMHHYAWNASAGRTTDWIRGQRRCAALRCRAILRDPARGEPDGFVHHQPVGRDG